ncbi:NrfD/PsrC family molybdoenzyme membrane anchor subunit [Halapricum desulfuricans]|uniref:Formate-dependent nitrite reductase, membrane component n=1 Tax=Halapricum desulfuricans TaxID=2841257 RepID=A0A897NCP0_9EURY|nr:NrfD/PsrC family molybdoenzyme membrane anchor subunit [Halapricum desulfuricans]QSG09205.1 Formate-dependent nitrite reductase, membrane component [Halapricum desulfuricans]
MSDIATGSDLLWIARGHWEIFIATYLFLGGLSGGAYLTSVVSSEVFRPRARGPDEIFACEETSRWGAIVGVLAIAVGGVALLSHLGAPLRALTFPVLFTNFGSWLVIGTWFIVLFALFVTIEAFWLLFGEEHAGSEGLSYVPRWIVAWIDDVLPLPEGWSIVAALDWLADRLRPTERARRVVHAVGSVAAVGVIVYTALLLTDVSVVPLWDRQYLPIVFLMSGPSTGISAALLGTVASGGGLSRTNHLFCLADDALIAVETVTLVGLLVALSSGSPAGEQSYDLLVNGAYFPHFAVGVLALGLVVPFGLSMTMTGLVRFTDIEHRWGAAFTGGFALKYVLVLAGGFLLRYTLLFGAVKQPLGVP